MAAMNLLTSAESAANERIGRRRNQKETEDATEVRDNEQHWLQNSYPSLQSRKRTDQKLASRARDFSRRTRQATAYSNVPTTTV